MYTDICMHVVPKSQGHLDSVLYAKQSMVWPGFVFICVLWGERQGFLAIGSIQLLGG